MRRVIAGRPLRAARQCLLGTSLAAACAFLLYSGCQEQQIEPLTDAGLATDAPFDAQASQDASRPPPNDADPNVPCESHFKTAPGCVHPKVESQCANDFCTIPPGCFVIGSPECQAKRGALSEPEAQVTLTHRFEIGEHEVTQAEWVAAGFANNAQAPNLDAGRNAGSCLEPNCPAMFLTWFDAVSYANRASATHVPPLPECYTLENCTGTPGNGLKCAGIQAQPPNVYECRGYRLPTEAEWEYSARAGTRTPYYSGPMTRTFFDPVESCHTMPEPNLDKIGWYCGTPVSVTPLIYASRPVKQKLPNNWGLYDMLGNAREWTSDPYSGLGYREGPYTDLGSSLGTSSDRTVRGGGHVSAAGSTTASYRGGTGWNVVDAQGFRLARSLD